MLLYGYGGDKAPMDEAGFLQYAASLPNPDKATYMVLLASKPVSPSECAPRHTLGCQLPCTLQRVGLAYNIECSRAAFRACLYSVKGYVGVLSQ